MLFLSGIATPRVSIAGNGLNYDTLSPGSFSTPDSLRARYLFTDGLNQMLIHSDTAEALRLFDQALALDSNYAPALFYKTIFHLEHIDLPGAREQAREYAGRAYLQDTMNPWYTSAYARTLALEDRLMEAIPLFRRLLKLDPNNIENYRMLALLYQHSQQPYAAISVLDSADTRFGRDPYIRDMKRQLLLAVRQHDRIIEEAIEDVEIAPYEQKNWITLGMIYEAAGRDSLAQETLYHAFKMDSTSIEALTAYANFLRHTNKLSEHFGVTQILFRQKNFPLDTKLELMELYTGVNELYADYYYSIGNLALILHTLYPTDPRVVAVYARHLMAGGDLEQALAVYKQHLDDEPPHIDNFMAVCYIEEYLQRPDSVELYINRTIEVFGDNPEPYIRKGYNSLLKGDYREALATFRQALEYADNDTLRSEIHGYIGDIYHQIAEEQIYKQREQELIESIERDLGDIITPSASGADTTDSKGFKPLRISAKKAMQECYKAYDRALELFPRNSMVLNNYAYFLAEENIELERALAMSSEAIHLESGNATFLDTHAWVLHRLGRNEEAQKYMRQALSLDDTQSAELPLHYGDILYALGKEFLAQTYWQKAEEMGADELDVAQRVYMLEKKKRAEKEQKEQ